jgi:hypothetical protein
MLQLLADRATEGLEREDALLLKNSLATNAEIDNAGFEKAAAVVALTQASSDEEALPTSLRTRLLAAAAEFLSSGDQGFGRAALPTCGLGNETVPDDSV